MNIKLLFSLSLAILNLVFIHPLVAQNQASNWIFNGVTLNFQSDSVVVTPNNILMVHFITMLHLVILWGNYCFIPMVLKYGIKTEISWKMETVY